MDTSSSTPRDAHGRRLLTTTLAGAGLLAIAIVAMACDQQHVASQSAQSREVAAKPGSRDNPIRERIVHRPAPREPMMHSADRDDDILDDIPEEPPTAPLDPPPEAVASDTVERIDALAERIRDESGPARKAAIREAMSLVAELPPNDAAALLARLDRTATPPDHEHPGVEPTPRGD